MRKEYPYLQDSYYEDANSQRQRRNFLATIDNFINQKQYVKVTLLNWQEDPIKEIEGELVSGTISKDGSSSVRRTCQFTTVVNRGEYTVEDGEMDFAINKKIFVEIGIKNYSDQYKNYPILWFPQGVFFIGNFAITSSASSNVQISLSLKDKMCGLNGDVGGVFQSTTILDELETQTPSGQTSVEKVLIYDIIQEVVNHFGGEDLNNIVIEDVPLRIRRVMKWTGDNPIYLVKRGDSTSGETYDVYVSWDEIPEDDKNNNTIEEYPSGADVGYIYDDFYYTSELTANAGENVVTVLDKIIQYLGNYEYFYDEFGVFHFREIKNYLNTTQSTVLLNDMDVNSYLVDVTTGKDIYTFSDNSNLISISANPSYANIKNDYVVHGLRPSTTEDISYDVFYHLVIDNKPIPLRTSVDPDTNATVNYYNTYYDLLLYKDDSTGYTKAAFPLAIEGTENDLPLPGNFNIIYKVQDTTEENLNLTVDEYENRLEDLDRNTIPNLEAELQDLQNQLDLLNQEIKIFEDELLEYNNKNHSLDQDLTSKKEELNELNEQLSALQKQITTAQSSQATYQRTLMDLKDQKEAGNPTVSNTVISDYQALVDSFQDVIDSYNEQIYGANGLQNKIDNLEKSIEQDELSVENNNMEIDSINKNKQYIELITERINLKTKIQEKESEIGRNETERTTIENQIDSLREEIEQAQQDKINNGGWDFFYWEDDVYKQVDVVKYYLPEATGTQEQVEGYEVTDWRTELYLQGLLARNNGTDAGMYYNNLKFDYTAAASDMTWIGNLFRQVQNSRVDTDYYFEELDAFWPSIYNLEKQEFYAAEDDQSLQLSSFTDGNYFLDFIEPFTSNLGEFSVQNIGRRTQVTTNDDINCLFQPNIPDIIFLNIDSDNIEDQRNECIESGYSWTQVRGDVYYALATGGYKNGAYDQIKYELYLHTNYQKTLSLSALPVFYLEPNSRVTINDKSTNTYGSYEIKSISIPFGPGSSMAVSCSECFERF